MQATKTSDSDVVSVFTYEGGHPDEFNLSQLNKVAAEYFGKACVLVKLGEGGNHKVYDVIDCANSKSLDVVVRVACPAFPKDKMLSEIATIKYIAAHTSIPVPNIFMWDADAANTVGAEYMIMEKIPGISPWGDKWRSLPLNIKLNVVKQVAEHLAILFSLRFEEAGSLYLSESGTPSSFKVGPIISLPFYRAIDGAVSFPDMPSDVHQALESLRGPFPTTSDYLSSFLKAPLLVTEHLREQALIDISSDDPATTLINAQNLWQLGLDLCRYYPGDRPIPFPTKPSNRPFTLMLDDFRLANILIDEVTGIVNGYIDFEGATVVPLWQSATVPEWIPDPDGDTANWYGGTPEDQRALWSAFHTTMDENDGGEWREAFEKGDPFRLFAGRLCLGAEWWGKQEMEVWVKSCLEWSKRFPGTELPEKELY